MREFYKLRFEYLVSQIVYLCSYDHWRALAQVNNYIE